MRRRDSIRTLKHLHLSFQQVAHVHGAGCGHIHANDSHDHDAGEENHEHQGAHFDGDGHSHAEHRLQQQQNNQSVHGDFSESEFNQLEQHQAHTENQTPNSNHSTAARTADTSRTPQTFQQHVHTQSSQTSQFVRSSNPQTQHPQQGQPTANTYSSGFVSARNTSPTPSQTGTGRSEGNQPRTPSQERQSPTQNTRPSSNGSLLFQQSLTPRFASSFVEKAAHFAQSQRPESFLRQSPSLENTSNGSNEVKNGHRSAFSEALNPRFSSEFGSILKSLSQASSSPKLFSMLQTLPPSLKGLLLTLIPSQNNPFLSKLIPFSQKMNLGLETLTRTHKGSLEAATLEMLPEEAVLNEVLEELGQSHPLFQGSSLSFPNLMDRLQKMMNQFSKILFGTFSLKDTPEKTEAEQLLLMQLAIFMKLKEKLEKKSLKKSKTSFTEEIEEEFWEELEKNFEDPQHRGRFFQNKDLLQNIHY